MVSKCQSSACCWQHAANRPPVMRCQAMEFPYKEVDLTMRELLKVFKTDELQILNNSIDMACWKDGKDSWKNIC